MKKTLLFVVVASLSFTGFSQKPDTLINKLDSLSRKTDSAGNQENNINAHAYDTNTRLRFGSYFTLLASDIKQEFTKPFHMTKKDWKNLGKFAVVEGTLSLFDEGIQKKVSPIKTRDTTIANISKFITNFGGPYETITLATLGTYGFLFKDKKMQTTTLLATQAYITGGLLEVVVKRLTNRTRPNYYAANTEAEPSFLGPFKNLKNAQGQTISSSFPSGHATIAFAAATVYASEYSNRRWVPIVAYTSATLIGLSRITENKHWATDVLAGAAIGFLAGKNVVNNYHRYAKLRSPNTPKNHPVTLSLKYNMGHLEPGLTYKI